MRNFYVKIGNGKSVSTFDIYWDIINPSNYAKLFGSTTSATDISYSQMKSYPGVLVEVPDSAASIIVNSSQPTFCQGFGTSTTVYSYILGTSSCIVPILTSATHNPNDTVTYVWNVGGFDYGTGTTLLEYSINSGSSWVNVGTVSPNGPSATSSVISVSYGTPIQYRVVCYGNGCSGMISNVISSTFSAPQVYIISMSPTDTITPGTSATASGTIIVNSAPITFTFSAFGGAGQLNVDNSNGWLKIGYYPGDNSVGSWTCSATAYAIDTKQITLSTNTTYYATMWATFVGSSGNNVRIY